MISGQRDSVQTRQPDWLETRAGHAPPRTGSRTPPGSSSASSTASACLAFRAGQQLRLMTRNRQQVTSHLSRDRRCAAGPGGERLHCRRGRSWAFDGDQTSFFPAAAPARGPRSRAGRCAPRCPYTCMCSTCCGPTAAMYGPCRWRERKRLLRGLLSFRDPLRFTEHRDADGEAYWREACQQGLGRDHRQAGPTRPIDPGAHPGLAEVQMRERAGVSSSAATTRPPGIPPPGSARCCSATTTANGKLRYAGKVGTGFDRRTPDQPARGPGRRRETGAGLRARPRPAQVRGALGGTPARRPGRFPHRMDGGRAAGAIPDSRACGGTRTPADVVRENALKGPA